MDIITAALAASMSGGGGGGSDSYTKAETDALLAAKADKSDTYTKAQVDAELAEKLDTADVDAALSNTSANPVQNKVITHEINTIRMALGGVLLGLRIDKQNNDPDTRVEYLYDAVGLTPAYMDFTGGSFNYGSFANTWFVKNNRPVALTFAGEVDYELSHTDFTKRLDGVTASDIEDATYAGNFMAEIPCVYVKRWEDERYNYIAFSDKKMNDDFLAQAHTNASGVVNDVFYAPMFKGFKDTNSKLRSLMGTIPTGSTTAAQEVATAEACGSGWYLWDRAKIDLIMDLIILLSKSTDCQGKIGTGVCNTGNSQSNLVKSGYETDGTTKSANAQFFGSEGNDSNSNYGKHHMSAFFVEDLWGNRWDRVPGFNLDNNVYKVKMTPPYALESDTTYTTLSNIAVPNEGWVNNMSSGVYGLVPTAVGASKSSGFCDYLYKDASSVRLALFGGHCSDGLKAGRCWNLVLGAPSSYWHVGGSPCFNRP